MRRTSFIDETVWKNVIWVTTMWSTVFFVVFFRITVKDGQDGPPLCLGMLSCSRNHWEHQSNTNIDRHQNACFNVVNWQLCVIANFWRPFWMRAWEGIHHRNIKFGVRRQGMVVLCKPVWQFLCGFPARKTVYPTPSVTRRDKDLSLLTSASIIDMKQETLKNRWHFQLNVLMEEQPVLIQLSLLRCLQTKLI